MGVGDSTEGESPEQMSSQSQQQVPLTRFWFRTSHKTRKYIVNREKVVEKWKDFVQAVVRVRSSLEVVLTDLEVDALWHVAKCDYRLYEFPVNRDSLSFENLTEYEHENGCTAMYESW